MENALAENGAPPAVPWWITLDELANHFGALAGGHMFWGHGSGVTSRGGGIMACAWILELSRKYGELWESRSDYVSE